MHEATDALRLKLSPVPGGRYLLGLSGGADSVALLMMLLPAIREGHIQIEAVHVNHGLRGKDSDGDERFCSELCKKEGIPLYTCKAELSGRRDEASARAARYEIIRKRYLETGADGLILAHHADDQAETYLMRLLRGSGTDGLACMKADETVGGIRILRPMLGMRREEIRQALQADGIAWREDASNRDPRYLRNRIRQELIPEMLRINAGAVEKICTAAALSEEDRTMLNMLAADTLNEVSAGRTLDADALAKKPAALRKRVLRMWWQIQGPELEEHALSAAQTDALDGLLDAESGKINLPGDMHAVRGKRHLFLTGREEAPPEPVTVDGPDTVFGDFRLEESKSEGNPGDGKTTQEVPAGFTRGCVIRTRLPGDRIRPFGSTGSRKLQDYLTDRRIEEPFRDLIPLLCRDGEVLLVCGVGAGNIPRYDPESQPVRLTWHGDMPWKE